MEWGRGHQGQHRALCVARESCTSEGPSQENVRVLHRNAVLEPPGFRRSSCLRTLSRSVAAAERLASSPTSSLRCPASQVEVRRVPCLGPLS